MGLTGLFTDPPNNAEALLVATIIELEIAGVVLFSRSNRDFPDSEALAGVSILCAFCLGMMEVVVMVDYVEAKIM